MSQYTSLLLGGKKPRKAVSAEIASARLEALARGRATRMANIKGNIKGKGYYNQDYVANGQVNYAGNPVDMLGVVHPKDHSKGNSSSDDDSEGLKLLTGQGKKKMSKEDKQCMRMAKEEMMQGNGLTRPQKRNLKKSLASKERSNVDALPEAIQVLGHLASLFGMKMMSNE